MSNNLQNRFIAEQEGVKYTEEVTNGCKYSFADGFVKGMSLVDSISDMFRFGRYLGENYEWHDNKQGEDRYKHYSGKIYLESTVWEIYIHSYYR